MMGNNRDADYARIRHLVTRYISKRWAAQEEVSTTEHFDSTGIHAKIIQRIERRTRARRLYAWSAAAAAALIAVTTGLHLFRASTFTDGLSTPSMEVTAESLPHFLELPDGSAVWLNAGATLRYSEGLDEGRIREVVLAGEAFFSVVPDSGRPFSVRTGEIRTTVLGTTFNVSSFPRSAETEVVVLSGKVAVAAADGTNRQLLTANQRSRHANTGELLGFDIQYDAQQHLSWIGKAFNFRSTPVSEIASQAAKRFGGPIVVEPSIRDCVVTADFADESLEGMMQALAVLVGGHYEHRDGTIYLTGSGCYN